MSTMHGCENKVKTMGCHGWNGNLQIMPHENKELDVWEWFEENEALVRAVVKTSCRGCYYLQDELFSEACSRLPRIFENYDVNHPSHAKISTKVVGDLKWYLWRWMKKRLKSIHVSIDAPTIESKYNNDDVGAILSVLSIEPAQSKLDVCDQVQFILGKLNVYDRHILALYHLGGNTLLDIANILGCCKATASIHYHEALKRAQEIARNIK